MRKRILLLSLLTLSISPLYAVSKKYIVVLQSPNISDMKQSEKNLIQSGFIVHHRYPPHILKGIAPENFTYTQTDSNILTATDKTVIALYINQLPENFRNIAESWNNELFMKPLAPSARPVHLPPLLNDARRAKDNPKHFRMHAPALSAPYGAGVIDTSEYMMGSVSLSVILPESTGTGTENWSSAREQQVRQKIEAGCQFWIDLDSRAHLSFTYTYIYGRTDTRAQVSCEPIDETMNTEYIWINEIMDALGYTSYDYYYYIDQVRNYDRDHRDANNTNWAVTVFVVDSDKDGDGMFADGSCAYSYLGGPFLVMTYDNSGYKISNMDYVFSHELAHSFWACDEYYASITYNDETTQSGYLDIINGNFENSSGTAQYPCIMRNISSYNDAEPVCTCTLQQVGWRDTDEDNIFDIADTLDITLNEDLTFEDNILHIEGTATGLPPYINRNSLKELYYGEDSLNNITIRNISDIQYRFDDSAWVSASPSDNAFNSPAESFACDATAPENGFSLFQVRAIDSLNINTTVQLNITPLVIANNQITSFTTSLTTGSLTLTAQPFTFMTDTLFLIKQITSFPSPVSNAAIFAPTGVGANIIRMTDETQQKEILLTFTCPDASIIGMNESHLKIAYYDEDWTSWVPLETTVNTQANTVSAYTGHFSYFQVMESIAAQATGDVKPYPNPFILKKGHTQIVFSHITGEATIKIYTLLGELVRTLNESDGDGLTQWDVTNNAGKKVASGTYIYRVKGSDNSVKMGRIIVIR